MKLPTHSFHMSSNSLRRDVEHGGNFLVATPAKEQDHDVLLAGREPFESARFQHDDYFGQCRLCVHALCREAAASVTSALMAALSRHHISSLPSELAHNQ
jgi:hypothetical protein